MEIYLKDRYYFSEGEELALLTETYDKLSVSLKYIIKLIIHKFRYIAKTKYINQKML